MAGCNASTYLVQVWLIIFVYLNSLSGGQSSLTNALLAFTSYPTIAEAGQTYSLGFESSGSDPVTILLERGSPANLLTVATLTTSADARGGIFTWTVDNNSEPGTDYALRVSQGSKVNYSGLFEIKAASASGVSVSPVAVTPTTSAVAATSALVVVTPAASVAVIPAASQISSSEVFSTLLVSSARSSSVFSPPTSIMATSFTSPPSPSTLSLQQSISSPSIATSTSATVSQPSSSSLSPGTKGGIAVGVVIGVMLIAAAVYCMGIWARNRPTVVNIAPQNEKTIFGVELEDGQARGELHGRNMRKPELHGLQAPTAELPTGRREPGKMA